MASPASDSSISPPATISTNEIKRRASINADRESSQVEQIYPNLSMESSLNDVECETDDEEICDEKDSSNNTSKTADLVHNQIPVTIPTAGPSDQKPSKSNNWVFIVILLAILFGVCIKYNAEDKHGVIAGKERGMANCSAFLNINQFPNQEQRLWKSLKTGIEGTYNDKVPKPSVFALFSNDKDTMRSIMRQIVDITHKCTNSSETPLNVSKTDLSSKEFQEDHTMVILKFKDELQKREIMIINDIDKVPISVIPSLHSFCDTYNPLVAKSIIFLTIHVPQVPSGKPVEYIHDYLQKKWEGVKPNILDPLITRITDQTFFLNKENV